MTDLIEILKFGTPSASLLGIVFLLYKTGVLGAFASRINGGKKEHETRMQELETFKEAVEGNHLHDLTELKSDMREVKDDLGDIRERLVRLETKVLNGTYKP